MCCEACASSSVSSASSSFFFFNDTATTEIYTLSLHDALPICRQQPQGSPSAQSRLWLRVARRRGGPAEGQTYRQCAEDHSHRAIQGSQGPQCHAVIRDARSLAPMVEGAPIASRCPNACAGTLVISWHQGRQAYDHPPAQPTVS